LEYLENKDIIKLSTEKKKLLKLELMGIIQEKRSSGKKIA